MHALVYSDHHVHDDLSPRDNDDPSNYYDSSCRYDDNWFAPRQRQGVAWNDDDGSDTDSDNGGDHALPKPTDAGDVDTDSEGEDADDEDEGELEFDVSFDPVDEDEEDTDDEESSSDFWPTVAALILSAGTVVPIVTAITYLGAALSWLAVGAILTAVTVCLPPRLHTSMCRLTCSSTGHGRHWQRYKHSMRCTLQLSVLVAPFDAQLPTGRTCLMAPP
jgi:hypothetical protein